MKLKDSEATTRLQARASMLIAQAHLLELVNEEGTDSAAGRALDYLRAAIDAMPDDILEDVDG
jgi:hypothetical protein